MKGRTDFNIMKMSSGYSQNLMGLFLVFASVSACSAQPVHEGEESDFVPLTFLPVSEFPDATCLDGSPAGFYYSPGEETQKWVIFFQGGGECTSADECAPKLKSSLGSSDYIPKQLNAYSSMPKFTSKSKNINPGFYTWQRVFLPYCSQDLWTGTGGALSVNVWTDHKMTANSTSTNREVEQDALSQLHEERQTTLHFRGHNVFKAILTSLEKAFPESFGNSASDIILSGESAGGFGAFNNVDYLMARYPKTRVTGAPVAGFYFFSQPYTGPGHTDSELSDFRQPAWPHHYSLWKSRVNTDCAKRQAEDASSESYCILANYTAPFLPPGSLFVMEAQSDKVQLELHDWINGSFVAAGFPPVMEYLEEWRKNMTQALHLLHPDNGYFFPACYIHTDFSDVHGPFIQGATFGQAFHSWYNGAGSVRLEDTGKLLGGECNKNDAAEEIYV